MSYLWHWLIIFSQNINMLITEIQYFCIIKNNPDTLDNFYYDCLVTTYSAMLGLSEFLILFSLISRTSNCCNCFYSGDIPGEVKL